MTNVDSSKAAACRTYGTAVLAFVVGLWWAYLPADGLQERPYNVSLVGVRGEAHNDTPGVSPPVRG